MGGALAVAFALVSQNRARLLSLLGLSFFFFLIFSFYSTTKPPPQSQEPWYHLPAPCRLSDGERKELRVLLFKMHSALRSLHVPHALCYGTLWGALREGSLLPWDNNVDLCALDSHFVNVSSSQLTEAFAGRDLRLEYDWRRGVYDVFVPLSPQTALGHIYVFTNSTKSEENGLVLAMPGGWVNRVWRWFGHKQVSFPAWLLKAPFNVTRLHGTPVPVPHDGIEMLKYLYPNDWWLEVKPRGCV